MGQIMLRWWMGETGRWSVWQISLHDTEPELPLWQLVSTEHCFLLFLFLWKPHRLPAWLLRLVWYTALVLHGLVSLGGAHNGQKMSLSTPFLPSSHRVSLFLASCLVDSVHGEAIKATSNSRLLSPEIRGCLLQVVVTKNPRGDSD